MKEFFKAPLSDLPDLARTQLVFQNLIDHNGCMARTTIKSEVPMVGILCKSGLEPERRLFCFFVLYLSSICTTSLGYQSNLQTLDEPEEISKLTEKITQNPKDASLYLERSRVYLEIYEQEFSNANPSALAFPFVRQGIDANANALGDASTAIELDSTCAEAYFQRAKVRICHPELRDYMVWWLMQSHFDSGPYVEYGKSTEPKNMRVVLSEKILPDLNTGLKLQPNSKDGQEMRWLTLRTLGKSAELLEEINEELKHPDLEKEREISLRRCRLFIFQMEKLGDSNQANLDAKVIAELEVAVRSANEKSNAEALILKLTNRLASVDLTEEERLGILQSRAHSYRLLDLEENASADEKEVQDILEKRSRRNITGLQAQLSNGDLEIRERIRLLHAIAEAQQFIGEKDSAENNRMEAGRLDFQLAKDTYAPFIERLSRQISENTTNASKEHRWLLQRAQYYERTNQNELAKADRDLARKIADEGERWNSKLIGGTGE